MRYGSYPAVAVVVLMWFPGIGQAQMLSELVNLYAPALWFTRAEQMLNQRNVVETVLSNSAYVPRAPQQIPCQDRDIEDPQVSDTATVYWQVTAMVAASDTARATLSELSTVRFLQLDYFFYYPMDWGANGHPHDLERMTVILENVDVGSWYSGDRLPGDLVPQYELALIEWYRATFKGEPLFLPVALVGHAHGSDFFANRVVHRVAPGLAPPLVALVEENKHATAPDVDRDGRFTLGSDVNRMLGDAWGIRDSFGHDVLVRPGFESAMSKPRFGDQGWLVVNGAAPRAYSMAPQADDWYELKSASAWRTTRDCNWIFDLPFDGGGWPEQKVLVDRMNENRFGLTVPDTVSLWEFEERWLSTSWTRHETLLGGLGVSARWDRGAAAAIYLGGWPLDAIGSWIVPRIRAGVKNDQALVGVDLLYTPSASTWAGWGAALGVEWEAAGYGSLSPVVEISAIPARAKPSQKWSWFPDGFWAIRMGAVLVGISSVDDLAVSIELGTGIW